MLVILVCNIHFHAIFLVINADEYFLGLLAALVGPLLNKSWFLSWYPSYISLNKFLEHLRITCDLMNFYFAFDEYTDLANETEATKISNDVMEAFRRRDASMQPSLGKITTMAQQ